MAQALAANGHGLHFHGYGYRPAGAKRESAYEVDFLVVRGKRICPIEVKSSRYKSHKSFDYFTEKYDVKVNERFIVHTKNLAREENLTYLPLYMAMCLQPCWQVLVGVRRPIPADPLLLLTKNRRQARICQ